jgi:hypothetical protein
MGASLIQRWHLARRHTKVSLSKEFRLGFFAAVLCYFILSLIWDKDTAMQEVVATGIAVIAALLLVPATDFAWNFATGSDKLQIERLEANQANALIPQLTTEPIIEADGTMVLMVGNDGPITEVEAQIDISLGRERLVGTRLRPVPPTPYKAHWPDTDSSSIRLFPGSRARLPIAQLRTTRPIRKELSSPRVPPWEDYEVLFLNFFYFVPTPGEETNYPHQRIVSTTAWPKDVAPSGEIHVEITIGTGVGSVHIQQMFAVTVKGLEPVS